jgi:hypothetical protein
MKKWRFVIELTDDGDDGSGEKGVAFLTGPELVNELDGLDLPAGIKMTSIDFDEVT